MPKPRSVTFVSKDGTEAALKPLRTCCKFPSSSHFLFTPITCDTRRGVRTDIVSRFQQYLQIDTSQPNPNYKPAVDFILSQAKSIGLRAQILEFVKDKPVVLISWQGKQKSLPSILLNSHTDVVPAEKDKWVHHPFSGHRDSMGDIYARGSQDMKCVSVQYLEALRNLKKRGFVPLRTIHISFVPDEEIGGHDGAEMFVNSEEFQRLNMGVVLDEGLASLDESYRIFFRTQVDEVVWGRGQKIQAGRGSDGFECSTLMANPFVSHNFINGSSFGSD